MKQSQLDVCDPIKDKVPMKVISQNSLNIFRKLDSGNFLTVR